MPSSIFRFFSNFFDPNDQDEAIRDAEPPADPLQDELRNLIAQGNTEEALQKLRDAGFGDNVALFKYQLDSGKAYFEDGKIKIEEWMIIQNRVNYAILGCSQADPQKENRGRRQQWTLFQSLKKISEAKPRPADTASDVNIAVTEEQKNEVRQLLLQNKTEEALALCGGWNNEFILIRGRYLHGKRHWHMGLFDESTWTTIQRQVNEALLFLLNQHAVTDK